MKRYFIFLFALLFCVSPVIASEIAIVDVEHIVKNSSAFKRLNDSLEKEKKEYQEKIKQKEVELNAKRDDLQSKASLFSQEVLKQKSEEFQKDVLDFQEEVKKKEGELQTKLLNGLNILNEEIKEITKNIVKEKEFSKYDVVANSTLILYHKESDNITLEILKRLNKKNISLINNKKAK